jgi:hypothetical protein
VPTQTNTIPSNEPQRLRAGDTWEWTKRLDQYPADQWTLKYFLRAVSAAGSGTIDIVAAQDPNDGTLHHITVAALTTAPLAVGEWSWMAACFDKATGLLRYTIEMGTVFVDVNLQVAAAGVDGRTHNQKMYDAIVAALEKRVTKGEESYQINGRSLKHLSPKELEDWKGIYANRVRKEMADNGQLKQVSNAVKIRFGPPSVKPVLDPFQ